MVATMRIGELAAQAGVSPRALRYYEEQGLLAAVRSPAGQRRYPESAVERVRLIQHLYAANLSSRTIAELLPCWKAGHTDTEQRAMLRAEREGLEDEQIERARKKVGNGVSSHGVGLRH